MHKITKQLTRMGEQEAGLEHIWQQLEGTKPGDAVKKEELAVVNSKINGQAKKTPCTVTKHVPSLVKVEQSWIEVDRFDNMKFSPELQGLQDERQAKCQAVCKRYKKEDFSGIRIKYTLADLAEYHGKVYKKQQAWEEQNRQT